jgi:hypothetical protein
MNVRILAKKGTFLASLAAIVGLSIGSLAFSQAVSFGAETDGGSETDVSVGDGDPAPSNSQAPTVGAPTGQPPAAPIDPNAGAVGGDANALPSTGSGGYLDADSSGSLPYALVALAVAIALTGSMAYVASRK